MGLRMMEHPLSTLSVPFMAYTQEELTRLN